LKELKPRTVIVDPISSLITIGSTSEVRAMLVRLMDTLKMDEINAVFTSLTHSGTSEFNDATVDAVSSLADTWIEMSNGAKNNSQMRNLLIIKSRGMGHVNSPQNFTISDKGIQFLSNSKK